MKPDAFSPTQYWGCIGRLPGRHLSLSERQPQFLSKLDDGTF
jgi:hypothetical protein